MEEAERRGHGSFSQEFRLRRGDGTFRWVLLRARAIPGAEQTAARCVGTLTDVTAARRAQDQLLSDAVRDRVTGLPNLDAIRIVCTAVSRPVNVVMGLSGRAYTVEELAEAGVKRISVGGSFARAALGALIRAAREVKEHGTFTYAADAIPDAEARAHMVRAQR